MGNVVDWVWHDVFVEDFAFRWPWDNNRITFNNYFKPSVAFSFVNLGSGTLDWKTKCFLFQRRVSNTSNDFLRTYRCFNVNDTNKPIEVTNEVIGYLKDEMRSQGFSESEISKTSLTDIPGQHKVIAIFGPNLRYSRYKLMYLEDKRITTCVSYINNIFHLEVNIRQ